MPKFQPGNKFGKGRPPRAVETDYLLALSEAVPLDRWRAIVERACEDALSGDDKARAWLANYLLPKPGSNELHHQARIERQGFDLDDVGLV